MLDKQQQRKLKRKYKLFRYAMADNFNRLLFHLKPSRKVNNREIRFVGLQRSGNHAILNWLFCQLKEVRCFLNYAKVDKNPFIYFHKKGTVTQFFQEDFYQKFNIRLEQWGFFSNKGTLMYSYEDEFLHDVFSETFEKHHDRWVGRSEKRFDMLLIRDPFNLFASRFKMEEKFFDKFSINNDDHRQLLVHIWKEHAREFLNQTNYMKHNKLAISYNHWFQDKAYRKGIAEHLGIEFDDGSKEEVLPVGGGSSFDDVRKNQSASQMKVLERWKHYQDHAKYREIFRDKEVVDLSNQIFGDIPGVTEWLV